jgi:hypothetical protein
MAEKNKSYRPSTSELLRTSFALDRRTASMVNHLKELHNAGSQTTYIKGLIALDWMETKKESLDLNRVPPWVILAYRLDVINGQVQPRKSK